MFALYVLVFVLAAVGCFVALPRLRHIEDGDTRRGLVALLLTTGVWATSHVGLLVSPTRALKLGWYVVGLVLGIVAVGAWLYFCSAYTGRRFHRHPMYRRLAVGTFLGIVALKLTNPLHGQYFTAAMVETPFPHLAVQNGLLHWLAMGLSYALAFVGYFMLVDMFTQIDLDTRPLLVLVGVTGLPVVADVLGAGTTLLIDITYEPIGVAVFAVGVGFVYTNQFDAVRLASERRTPTIALDTDGDVRETNQAARLLFPALDEAVGEPLETVLPEVTERLGRDDPILEVRRDGKTQFLRVTESPYSVGRTRLGRAVVFTDVTERERYRRELERQNDRLEQFAGLVSHDLRNPLGIAQMQMDLLREDGESEPESFEALERALERMEELIEETLTLSREGRPVERVDAVRLSLVVEDCWEMVESSGAELRVESDLVFLADPSRLRRVFENLFRNAVEHGSTSSRREAGDSGEHAGTPVTVSVGALDDRSGFYVADDGPGIPESERENVFETGYTTADDGTGFGLAIVRETVAAHRWEIRATENTDGGARFEVTDVRIVD